MTPYEQAQKLYSGRLDMSLENDWMQHIRWGGICVDRPEFIAMIRPVQKEWHPIWLADKTRVADRDVADCWFIWLLCGSLREAVKHLPYHLPWFGFSQRGQPARFVEAEKVLAKIR